jgi:cytochrome c oxidase subunit 1
VAAGPSAGGGLVSFPRRVFTTDHHALGIRYLLLSLVAVAIGAVMSLFMRLHLIGELRWIKPEDYLALVTLHGTLMLFFVLTVAPQAGFGNLILPAQIGSRRMAFPAINACAFWVMLSALSVLLASTFVEGGAAISGWTAYPPLSAVAAAGPGQGLGMDLWLISIGLFSISSLLSSVNLLATVTLLRCPGMTWGRLPLTIWAWFTGALLSVIAFSVLLAALSLLMLDRHAGTSFFVPPGDLVNGTLHVGGSGSPLLWLHLFWFFGHPEVYIAILPGMGLTSMILANFSRRRIFGYRIMVATTLLIGLLGIAVWGHHMFVAGLNPFAGTVFSISSMAIALPSAAKVFSWLATVWRSRPSFPAPMLFALGFVSLFIAGGLSGPILAQPILDQYLHNTYFVVAHFHLIMAMAGIFGLFAATYYWFPLLCGRRLSETLGKWHFWLTLAGAYLTFLPMHIVGLQGAPRHYAQFVPGPGEFGTAATSLLRPTMPLERHITYAAIFLLSAQLLFLVNLVRSLRGPRLAETNPWGATTLEWIGIENGQLEENGVVQVFRGPCEYNNAGGTCDFNAGFLPQWAQGPKAE